MTYRFTRRPLEAAARPRARYEYIVTGRGEFPFDMLRYDGAWPAMPDDVSKLTSFDYARPVDSNPTLEASRRSIRLASHYEPTIERWSSFGWSVGFEAAV